MNVLIPSKTLALRKIREAVGALALDCADSERLCTELGWINNALDEVLQLENVSFYVRAYEQGIALATEGVRRTGNPEAEAILRSLPLAAGSSEELRQPVGKLLGCLVVLTRALSGSPRSSDSEYLDRVIDWENSFYSAMAPEPALGGTAYRRANLDKGALQSYLRSRRPNDAQDLVVTDLQPLSGGFSKRTILFSCKDSVAGEQSLVIRAEKSPRLVFLEGAKIRHEYALVKYMHAAGRPVADALWLELDTSLLGAPFMVSKRIRGRNPGIGVAAMGNLPLAAQKSLMTTLARIHQTPVDRSSKTLADSHLMPWLQLGSLKEITTGWVVYWKEQLDRCGCPTTPNIERALAWLLRNVPADDLDPVFVHGDYTLGNILMHENEVTAVLDWELSYFGDPAYDFTSVMHTYDRSIVEIYEQAGGQPISEQRYNYYLIFKTLKCIPLLTALYQLEHPDARVDFYLLLNYIGGLVAPLNEMLRTVGE